MGSAIDDKAGVLAALRMRSSLATLKPLLDRLDNSQNLVAELILAQVKANYGPGNRKNILDYAKKNNLTFIGQQVSADQEVKLTTIIED